MLQTSIEALFDRKPGNYLAADFRLFEEFKAALNSGEARAAVPDPASPTGWRVNVWVKKGILLGFRMGSIVDMSVDAVRMPFADKHTYPVKKLPAGQNIRVVPGGSSIRDGCYIGPSVTCMPPMFVNAGAYVGEGTMIDSHVLIGSCAQIGKHCHISAGVQIGGVLEPVGELPVIVEDEVLIGGNSGVYEGTIVRKRAVLGTGTILNRSTPVYDVVRGQVYAAAENEPLVIPEQAVVVPGSRPISHGVGKEWNLSLYTPVIVKYRDAKTESRIHLEDLLR
jgi:2,3,4,5-tetrahydropyridine-2-carboxylate N-succinyltransferase